MTLAPEPAAAIDKYLANKSENGTRLFRAFQQLVESCGESHPSVSRTIVFFKRARVFAGAAVKGRRLEVVIDLLREIEHPLLLVSFPTTKKVFSHRLRIVEVEQLDQSVAALLREAYDDVGPGTRGR